MWILHPQGGFLSAVQHNSDTNVIVVRARIKSDLEELARKAGVHITGGRSDTDYPWRVMVERGEWSQYVEELAEAINYGNFKTRVGQVNTPAINGHDRADIYSRVWGALLDLENLDPEGRTDRLYY